MRNIIFLNLYVGLHFEFSDDDLSSHICVMEGITFDFIETSPQRVSENVVSVVVVVIIIIVPPHTQEWTTYSSELLRGNKSKTKSGERAELPNFKKTHSDERYCRQSYIYYA